MKNKQLLFEASLTAASGVAGVSVSQESSCSGPTAYLPSVFHYDDAMSDQPIVTYCGYPPISEEDTKYFKQKFEMKSKIQTMAGVHLNFNLSSLMTELELEDKGYGDFLGFSGWRKNPALIKTEVLQEKNSEIFRNLQDLIEQAHTCYKNKKVESISVEKTDIGTRFFLIMCHGAANPIFVPVTQSQRRGEGCQDKELIRGFDYFYRVFNPSQFYDKKDKKFVQDLISVERKRNQNIRVFEMNNFALKNQKDVKIFLSEENRHRTIGNGIFKFERSILWKNLDRDGTFLYVNEILCIKTLNLRILNFEMLNGQKYIFTLKKGENPSVDSFFERHGDSVPFVNSKEDLEKILNKICRPNAKPSMLYSDSSCDGTQ
eukprot:GHVP01014194.1.p1 GENE.GHVP01014194.1~~GHVP01014194.1.p1  ORF type:complete len:374 (-),score=61.40 GHVP01014194.1:67-1188(-)